VRRWFRLPFVASVAGHAVVLVLLILFASELRPLQLPAEKKLAITVMLAPPPPPAVEPPPPEPPPPPPPVVEVPPPPPPPPPTRPPPKVVVKPPPPQRPPPPQPVREPPPPVQTAALPPAVPPPPAMPVVSAGYRAALGAWLESHKHYPDSARSRGEEGRAVLRFRVARSGQLLNYAIVQGTGHADLDAALDQMMRGASLPPFPADMMASDVDVSVTIRFALAR